MCSSSSTEEDEHIYVDEFSAKLENICPPVIIPHDRNNLTMHKLTYFVIAGPCHTHTRTHLHKYIYIYLFILVDDFSSTEQD